MRWLLLGVGVLAVLFYIRSSSLSAALHSVHEPVSLAPLAIPGQYSAPATPLQPTGTPPAPIVEAPIVEAPIAEEPKLEPAQPVTDSKVEQPITKPKKPDHPIDTLISAADKIYEDLLKKESKDINTAAAEYRKRRGRHPPPGFDAWFKFAQENGAIMVEEFWDQIYHDLGPFWGLPPATMRKEAWDFEMNISVRNRNASATSAWFWTQIWLNLTQTIEHLLPDMDIALNAMDEPRIVLPWEKIDKYMDIERSTRKMVAPEEVESDFKSLSNRPDPSVKPRPKNWAENSTFQISSIEAQLTHSRTFLETCISRLPSGQCGATSRVHAELRSSSRHLSRKYNTTYLQRICFEFHSRDRFLPPARSASPTWNDD